MERIEQYLTSYGWTWLGVAALAAVVLCAVIGYRRGLVKEVFSTLVIFLSIGIVWIVNPYVNEFMREQTPVYKMVSDSTHRYIDNKIDSSVAPNSEEQTRMIENLGLPAFLTEGLETNNQAAVYSALGVTNFVDYMADYIAGIITNAIAFLVSFVLANLLLRILGFLLNIVANMPVIRGANKLAGAILGGGKCVIYIWIAMLIATILCNTDLGKTILNLVEEDVVLKQLFLYNPLSKWFTQITYAR